MREGPHDRADHLPRPRIVSRRTCPCPADPVFEAWTDEAVLATWWWAGLPDTQHQVCAEVGGDFAVSSQVAGLAGRGRFTRLERPRCCRWRGAGRPVRVRRRTTW
ncbi:hypothetical protein BJF82_14890 [Kytococcus sp. CUA-901]|nr:hypothetical protein BJF82_14890 [Kytococcus sp. CUA-901]